MKKTLFIKVLVIACIVQLVSPAALAAGTFRFLNTSLPDGSTSEPYYAVLLTANSVGAVTYSLDGASDAWPTGITMNASTGEIVGQAASSANRHMIINATDSNGTIQLNIAQFKINSSGSSGTSSITTLSLADGRAGVAYTPVTLGKSGGTGPFVWGVQNMPAGLLLNASTGEITGTPIEAGTFNITFALRDDGRSETIFRVLALTVLPADPLLLYNFQFETSALVNGEVGTVYADQYTVSGNLSTVTFSASGLPDGLTLNPLTGAVSGTPTESGAYAVTIGAIDTGGASISTNLKMWIVPSSSSNFYWSFFGVPPAIINESYAQTPSIKIAAVNGATVTYAADDLPPGMSYNTGTGELTGTPTKIGVFPVTFTATDTTPNPDVVLTLEMEFVVLPATGGDANKLPNKLWASKLATKIVLGNNNDSWSGTYNYNDDRTTANVFDPAVDIFEASLGNSGISIPAGTMIMDALGNFTYVSPAGVTPIVNVRGLSNSQIITVSVGAQEIGVVPPTALINNDIVLGDSRYRIKAALSSKGQFRPTGSYRNTSFVVTRGLFTETAGTLSLSMNLADPSFEFTQGDTMILKLYSGTTLLLSKDVTSMVTTTQKLNTKTGTIAYTLKKSSVVDPGPTNIFSKMGYGNAKGTMTFSMSALALLAPLTNLQEHLTVELVMGDTTYTTDVTFFETFAGSNIYSTAISTAATPF